MANHFKRFAGLRVLNGDRLIFLKDLPVVIGIISAMSGVILWLSITLTFATYIVRTLLQQRLCCRFFFCDRSLLLNYFFAREILFQIFFFLQQISCCRNSPRPGLLTFSKLWLGEVRMMMNHEKGNPNNSLQRLAATDFVAWQFTPAGSHVIE